MFKRLLTSVAASFLLICAAAAAPVEGAGRDSVEQLPHGQVTVPANDVNSTEVNTVEESRIAQEMINAEKEAKNPRMTREEKAENARVNDSWGGAITIIAMCIVVGALVVLSILFMIFGKISSTVLSKKKLKAHGKSKEDAEDHHLELDSGETIAAIGVALAEHFDTRNHDLEDTILTIRRMKRNYSPWSSKIYNLRELPEVHKNIRK